MADRVVFTLMAKDQLSKVFKGLSKGVKSFGDAAKSAAETAKRAFSGMASALKNLGKRTVDVARKMGRSFKGALSGIAKLGKVAFGAVAVGAAGATAGILGTIKSAATFDQKMREVWTMTDWTKDRFDSMSQAVIRASTAVPDSATDMAEAMRLLVSAGRESSDMFKLMESSSKLAVAGGGKTSTAMSLLSGMMNALQWDTSKAMDAADLLFATIRAGQTDLELMSQFAPKIFPTVATIGADPREALSAFATLTASMGDKLNAEAVTGLTAALTSLYSQKVPEDNPLSSFIMSLREVGPVKALARIRAFIEKIPQPKRLAALREIFPEQTAARSVGILLNNWKMFGDTLKSMMREAPGAVQAGFEKMSDGLLLQIQMLRSNIGALAGQIGQIFLPAITEVTKTLSGWVASLAKINAAKVWEQIWGNPEEALPRVKALFETIKTEFTTLEQREGGAIFKTFAGTVVEVMGGLASKISMILFKPLMTEALIMVDTFMLKVKIMFNELLVGLVDVLQGTPLGKLMDAESLKKRLGTTLSTQRGQLAGMERPETGEFAIRRQEAAAERTRLMGELRTDVKDGWEAIKTEGNRAIEEIVKRSAEVYRDLFTGELRPVPGDEATGLQAAAQAIPGQAAAMKTALTDTHAGTITIGGEVLELGKFMASQTITFNGQVIQLKEEIDKVKQELEGIADGQMRLASIKGTPSKSFGFAF